MSRDNFLKLLVAFAVALTVGALIFFARGG